MRDNDTTAPTPTREELIDRLNEDLAREYQDLIACVVYSETLIDYFNGTPTAAPKEARGSGKPGDRPRFDLENEQETIRADCQRILQAEAVGERALSEVLRKIIAQKQEHFLDLADTLGIDDPALASK